MCAVQFRKCLTFFVLSCLLFAIPKIVLSLKKRQYTFSVHSKLVNKIVQFYTHSVFTAQTIQFPVDFDSAMFVSVSFQCAHISNLD